MNERDKLFLSAHALLSHLFHTLRTEMNAGERRLVDEALVNSDLVFQVSSQPSSGGLFMICDRLGVSARVTFDLSPHGKRKRLDVFIYEND
jgi:hypothetical protein